MSGRRRLVRTTLAGGVARLTLDRPERHNSLVPELLDDLLAAIEALADEPSVRAVVLAAEGRSFSTGGDVRAFHDQPDERLRDYAAGLVGRLNRTILALLGLPQPVIARVQGPVTGGSLGLVLAADLVAATPEAFFAPYYVTVGFAPDGGWSALLPERIGLQRTREIQLLNRRVGAAEARALGLVTEVVEAGALDACIAGWLAILEGHVASGLRAARRSLLTDARRAAYAAGLEAERQAFLAEVARPETRRGMARFLGARAAG
ncbi:2-(1,2-epoxy-1,2-dihydrophenyl)acetyl-CoA isomerase [Tistlia consotensis]|uniref:2-(1,2-epoxy-1,2-dihydrophenyl)acetyl-CoA isomerase n=1 Tax=Tistlia consotensis USBA 355 TaxID=560819 RepID=A0A1Y6B4U2_9PROT|nr:enoyl-CoA hydratase/isomerase family protein [Tistlia consotensis]SME92082.1 2-(1,2-epoxy-1,2-dihydrophenyl)acetyl-CoA isomerase [Tistlia consotensis USBA 355]SNR27829.1 2-(1,2-epoxy-1,2-dihydrophenyl)acetyl-CoA isomerase [Tistlia consotensis]